jgi:hypothetical protein
MAFMVYLPDPQILKARILEVAAKEADKFKEKKAITGGEMQEKANELIQEQEKKMAEL